MAKLNAAHFAFNRGVVSRLVLGRADIDRLRLSAEEQTNFIPRTLGSMMLRPGFAYLLATKDDAKARYIPFVKSTDDVALVEVTASAVRVVKDDAVITRTSVTTAVSNGTFTTDLTDWTDADESGATSLWATGGYLSLVGTKFKAAKRRQLVAVTAGDQNKAHCAIVTVERGLVTCRIGSTSGGDEYVSEAVLRPGEHHLAFTPTGSFYIEFSATSEAAALVDSVSIASSGDMTITAPWAATDLPNLRWDQSGDVLFVACDGKQQRRIERRDNDSWSVCKYEPQDGPFLSENTSNIRLTPSAKTGDITVTASQPVFDSDMIGGLFRIDSVGQSVTATITSEGSFTNSIRVTGVDNARIFQVTLSSITGTGTTATLQRSIGEEGSWADVTTYTTNQSNVNFDDSLDNQIVFYRLGVDTGDYSTGTITATLTYASGSIAGVVRITAYTSQTSVSAAVLKDLGGTSASEVWREGVWSGHRGWPSSVAFFEGRLWWAGKDRIIGSVSDAFESFDPDTEGDSGPINRTIGSGPVDTINWILALNRMILGAEGAEKSVRSTSFDEPLTPTLFNIKDASTQGSSNVNPVKVDKRGYYVQRGGTRVYELLIDADQQDYNSQDRTVLVPEIGEPSVIALAVQRQPDTRVHCIRSDGKVAMLVSEPAENVSAWIPVETDGVVEDAVVLPGTIEDSVYYVVKRTVNGADVRYLEKWATEAQARGGTICRMADSFVTFDRFSADSASGFPTTNVVTGLTHLAGRRVIAWCDGKAMTDADGEIALFQVSATGTVTLTHLGSAYNAGSGCIGLPYEGRFKSAKLAYGAQGGTALAQRKKIERLALLLADTHYKGIRVGQDYNHLDPLPDLELGERVHTNTTSANKILYSEELSDTTYWTLDLGAAISTAYVDPPHGTETVFAIHDPTITQSSRLHRSDTINQDAAPFVFSLFVKRGDRPEAYIGLEFLGGSSQIQIGVAFDFDDETLTTIDGSPDDSGFETLPDGWYRIWIEASNNGTGNTSRFVSLFPTRGATADVTLTGFCYTTGWQVEAKSGGPTTYIPTSGLSITGAPDYIHTSYDNDGFPVNGTWDTDSRLYLKATAPRPCTVMAAVISMQTNERV